MIEKFWETLIIVLCFCWMCESCESKTSTSESKAASESVRIPTIDKHKLVQAFIRVESSGNDLAINPESKATGCLQQMPIMIREANRLVGYDKYKLSDRTDRSKSVEIFHLIMERKNPDYDIARACIIWNPRGGYKYLLKIEKEYNQLIKK